MNRMQSENGSEIDKAGGASPSHEIEVTPDDRVSADDNKAPAVPAGTKEHIYDRIPLSKKQLDVIIIVLIIALLFFFIVGAIVGNR